MKLRPTVLLLTAAGAGEDSEAEEAQRELEAMLGPEPVTVFVDVTHQTTVPTDRRDSWSRWSKAHRARMRSAHVLVRSRMVDMAMSLIGMFVGGGFLKSYHSEADFVAAIAREVPGFSKLPGPPQGVGTSASASAPRAAR